MPSASLPLPPKSTCDAKNRSASGRPVAPAKASTLGHLRAEAKSMARDVWSTLSTPKATYSSCKAEGAHIYKTLSSDTEYRTNIVGRWFNQVGGGLSHGGFLALLSHSTAVSAAGGLLASSAISFFEDRVAGIAQVHRGVLRDLARNKTQKAQEDLAQIKSRAASRLIVLGALDASVMACALGVVWCVSAGLLGSGGLLLALAAMQTVRTAIVIYQFACFDILKVQIASEGVRDIVNRKWTNAINNTEQGLGRTIYQVTLIVCQTASFFTPPAWQLPFTAAQIFVGMGLSAAGKLQFLPLIKVQETKPVPVAEKLPAKSPAPTPKSAVH